MSQAILEPGTFAGIPEGVTLLRWGKITDPKEFILAQFGKLSKANHIDGVVVTLKDGYDALYNAMQDEWSIELLPFKVPFFHKATFTIRSIQDWEFVRNLVKRVEVEFEESA